MRPDDLALLVSAQLHREVLSQVVAPGPLPDLPTDRFLAVTFPVAGFGPLLDGLGQLHEPALHFRLLTIHDRPLLAVEGRTEDHQQGAEFAPELTSDSAPLHVPAPWELQLAVVREAHLQEVRDPVPRDGAHITDLPVLQMRQVLLAAVALVEDQGQLFGAAAQPSDPGLDHGLPGGLELADVGPVSGVALVVEGKAGALVLEQGQGELAKIRPFLFVPAPLGQFAALVEGVDEGEVIGGVVQDGVFAQRKQLAEARHQVLLNRFQVLGLDLVHVVPEPLTRQLPLLGRTQSRQDAVLVPVLVKGALAAGIDHPVDGRQHQILTHTELGTTLGLHRWHMGVDQARQSQAVRPVPQPGGGSELAVLKTAQRRRAGRRTPCVGPFDLLQDPIAAARGRPARRSGACR